MTDSPYSAALRQTSALARSLYEALGLRVSSLTHRLGKPRFSRSNGTAHMGVSPTTSGSTGARSDNGNNGRTRSRPRVNASSR